MKEPYLLAASLLTGLTVPTSALPKMSSILPENTAFLEDLTPDSQSQVSRKVINNVDISLPEFSGQATSTPRRSQRQVREKSISLPEFSSQAVSISENSQGEAGEKVAPSLDILLAEFTNYILPTPIKTSLNFSSQKTKQTFLSGSQLYYLRLASLKTGQIYTRVDDDDLSSSWKSAKQYKLSYQDWKSLLVMEARAISQGQGSNRLSILVGDSLSLWFPKEKLPSGKLWLNQGISGDRSEGVLRRVGAFSTTRPEVIYLMVGINDLLRGASDVSILRNHRQIIRSLRQTHPKSQIMVQSILPIRRTIIPNKRIRHLNAQIALIAKQEGANYLNIHNWFTDFEGNLRSDLTTDGVHLTLEGYDVWQAALQRIEFRVAQSLN
ncbi:G-D-S-L family lipolytic protein [Anabaena cylindrica FACHB-243]|uniref:Lipolytic protein G-D-S-L family n=1 Tax=Anabaena cylindrica (strain ATCC 27899 / PCC 7122) TaxID=272123 RepID=K9ZPB8_ANACC|nr:MULTISPECIES: SGNH/GDSL hydrolase family protein [Anabaena]AFZ60170.1 lipolytic protein G-D-S-L family [Anabaena cylindrica PCC 7122]MBD2417776.1 G-D-S-L family lipolytic protein [Anabaena cylindrica FACHB-243]MBY5285322.1 G-D-S-L family lipolytic protein [Anabaena sp. CCAP 1446/1C]MBY5311600.1 G-D-S-L family lipolytic protein [Anabaena sp. CCAP 1446/1C]MCM2404691.1 SGNH/GDSL hydrolase family protein [Anabaena sp. CCAP 1446/1C]